MSLINQVLKDLEQRHAEQLVEATHSLDGLAFAPEPANKPARHWQWKIALLLLVVCAGVFAAYWYWQQQHHSAQDAQIMPVVANETPVIQQQTVTSKPAKIAQQSAAAAPKQQAEPEKPALTVAAAQVTPPRTTSVRTPPAAAAEDSGTSLAKRMVPLRAEQKAELSYQSGYQYLQQHQHRRAEQELREALRIEAGHNKARELLTGLLIKQGRWIEASEILQRGIQIAPHHRAFVTLQARTLMQLERDRQAIALLRDYAPPMHEDPEHYALLAALYQRQADHVSAANTYAQLLKLRPNAGIWWVGLGISLEALGKQPEARHAYQQAQQSGTLHADISRYTDNRLIALESIRYPVD